MGVVQKYINSGCYNTSTRACSRSATNNVDDTKLVAISKDDTIIWLVFLCAEFEL